MCHFKYVRVTCFFNSRDKLERNFIKKICASYMLLKKVTHLLKKKKKKSDTYLFYKLSLRKFLQPSLEKNFILNL
jgi:hypothetical protein